MIVCALGFGLIACRPSSALAQDRASAEELFQLGKGAMARQELTKACNYFQASLSADFALGTLLNLAICHEQAGKIASAWGEFRTLEDRSRRANPPQIDRAQFAHDHAEALRPRLSRVHVVLSAEASAIKGLVVKIDGAVAAPELFEAGVPVDLGKRKLSASAPEYEEWSTTLTVDDERQKLDATIPTLRKAPPKPTGAQKGSIDLAEVERVSAVRSQRTVGFVVGGIGATSLLAGAAFGLLALSAASDAKCPSQCLIDKDKPDSNPDLVRARDAYRRANTFAWVSNITLATGVVGLGIGGYLVLAAGSTTSTTAQSSSSSSFRSRHGSPSEGLRLTPILMPNGGGLVLAGGL